MSIRAKAAATTLSVLILIGEIYVFVVPASTPKQMVDQTSIWVHTPWVRYAAIAVAIALVLVNILAWFWDWIAPMSLHESAGNKRKSDFNSVQEIIREIPPETVPIKGRWSPSVTMANEALRSRVHNRQATLYLTVDRAEITPKGRYIGTVRVASLFSHDPLFGAWVLVHAYFEKAGSRLKKRVLSHACNDPILVQGKITRADLTQHNQNEICLNIDISYCTIADANG